jgi:hypothetical protein
MEDSLDRKTSAELLKYQNESDLFLDIAANKNDPAAGSAPFVPPTTVSVSLTLPHSVACLQTDYFGWTTLLLAGNLDERHHEIQ